jgi:polyisoprenoid-binding protein YceI
LRRQLAQDGLALGAGHVHGQRTLVAVGAQEIGGIRRRLALAVGSQGGPQPRVSSPPLPSAPGFSTLITSAPRSPSNCEAHGPASTRDRSSKVDAPPAAAARTLKADVAASTIGFVGSKLTGDHTGSFKAFTGETTVEGMTPKSVRFTIETGSVTSDDEKLTGHLKSPDFFDVEKYPKAEFSSTAIAIKSAAGGATHEVTGDLDLHGEKKSITFPATITVDDRGAKGTAEFKINRKDFKIVYPGMPDDLIKDEVLLKISLSFVP